jgi:hypothetical protein
VGTGLDTTATGVVFEARAGQEQAARAARKPVVAPDREGVYLGTAVPLAEDEYIELLAIRTERHLRHLRSVGGEAVTWPGECGTGTVGEPARGIAPED